MISDDFRILFFNQDSTACQCGVVVSNLISQAAWGGPRFHQITKALNDMRNMWGISVRPFCRRFYEAESQILWGRKWGYGCSSRMLEYVVSEFFLLGQWLSFKLFGITYLVGKIKFKPFFFRVHWLSEFFWDICLNLSQQDSKNIHKTTHSPLKTCHAP